MVRRIAGVQAKAVARYTILSVSCRVAGSDQRTTAAKPLRATGRRNTAVVLQHGGRPDRRSRLRRRGDGEDNKAAIKQAIDITDDDDRGAPAVTSRRRRSARVDNSVVAAPDSASVASQSSSAASSSSAAVVVKEEKEAEAARQSEEARGSSRWAR